MSESGLVVAVTGPTGTFGHGLMPQLQADDRVTRVVGVARRPFDPAVEGWTKMEYRQGDVRDQSALAPSFACCSRMRWRYLRTHIQVRSGLSGGESVIIGPYRVVSRTLAPGEVVKVEDPNRPGGKPFVAAR
mgnify:CR=1 FL=1